ncbi:hypothetical protein COLO4_18769 [Corchorus olitorius]|uniref:Uncharacterized protein n=1 Tax=Corchorus olitorius TaxID=93759 RepID=A0A1R3J801_9ROSI|nr:hypothetical protein COLO4_18769 [Corchorus olitorius]
MCRIIDKLPPGATKLSRAFAAASLYYNYSRAESCFEIEHEVDAHGLHGWEWQSCTEMVMPMTCSKESMFPPSGFDYEEFSEQCQMKYGVLPRPHWITTEFGGQDPWSRGGVLKNISASIIAIVTEKGLANLSVTDCGSNDPDLKQEMEKQFVDLLTEELKLQEAVSAEHARHMNITFGEAKRVASQYQREAEKCIAATETCEGAREQAEAFLIKERKLTTLWEQRARQMGWEGE